MTEQPKVYAPDIEAGLQGHANKWQGCQDCQLGKTLAMRVYETEPKRRPPCQIFGDGKPRGLMVIGPPPTWREERDGRFLAKGKYVRETNSYEPAGGDMVRSLLAQLKFDDVYFTGTTLCRACHLPEDLDGGGDKPVFYRDRLALDPEVKACRTRLHEEIYLVDPLLIIALGETVAKALTGRVLTQYGSLTQLPIPALTEVARIGARGWAQKDKRAQGGVRLPTEPWDILYPLMVVRDPEVVLRNKHNRDPRGEMPQFIEHFKLAVQMIRTYRNEVTPKETP